LAILRKLKLGARLARGFGLLMAVLLAASLVQMTQQNAALVEQSAAAAQSLKMQSEQLAEVVRHFKLEDTAVLLGRGPGRHAALPG